MDPLVDIVLKRKLPNGMWTYTKYRNIQLKVKKSITRSDVWMLIIGRTAKKEEIEITSNILTIHDSFLEKEGKATICFNQPPCECLLNLCCTTVENKQLLKSLVHNLKQTSNGLDFVRVRKPKQTLQYIQAQKDQATAIWRALRQTQLSIPHNWTSSVNLSGQKLTSLPVQLGDLLLKELRLDDNLLGQGPQFWVWMYGPIRTSLTTLSLDRNNIRKLPVQLVACQALKVLSLEGNTFEFLPPGLLSPKKWCTIRELNLAGNARLQCLFSPMLKLNKLNISGCEGLLNRVIIKPHCVLDTVRTVETLAEIAGQVVLDRRIPYCLHNLPRKLTEFLDNSMECTKCHKLVQKVGHIRQLLQYVNAGSVESSTYRSVVNQMLHVCKRCFFSMLRFRELYEKCN